MPNYKSLKISKPKDKDREGPRALGTLKQLRSAKYILAVGKVKTHDLISLLVNHIDPVATIVCNTLADNDPDVDFVIAFHDFIPNSKTVQPYVLAAIKQNVPCIVIRHGNTIDRNVVIK